MCFVKCVHCWSKFSSSVRLEHLWGYLDFPIQISTQFPSYHFPHLVNQTIFFLYNLYYKTIYKIYRSIPWASCQIRKIVGCACARNAGNVPPPPLPWCMPGSLAGGFLWNRWCGKRSRHSRRLGNLQFFVSGKKPIVSSMHGYMHNDNQSAYWTSWGHYESTFIVFTSQCHFVGNVYHWRPQCSKPNVCRPA